MRHSIKLADTAANLNRRPIWSFFSPVICVATHSGWLKAPDLEQMGACNQGKGILEFYSVSSGALRALCYWWEHWRTRRVCISAPFGVKGSNPLQDHAGVCMYPCLIKFRCGRCVLRALVPPTSSLQLLTYRLHKSFGRRASSKLLVHPSSFLLFGFTSFVISRS